MSLINAQLAMWLRIQNNYSSLFQSFPLLGLDWSSQAQSSDTYIVFGEAKAAQLMNSTNSTPSFGNACDAV